MTSEDPYMPICFALSAPASAKLDKQLKYANAKGIPYVAIIGPEEAAQNEVKVKNMATGEQKCLPEQELISFFS